MTTVKKIKIFADETRNNTFLIQKGNGEVFRTTQGSRFFERLIVEKHWTGRKTFSWVSGTTPSNEIIEILNKHIISGNIGECSYLEGFPEKF